jgi:hypothetical protein
MVIHNSLGPFFIVKFTKQVMIATYRMHIWQMKTMADLVTFLPQRFHSEDDVEDMWLLLLSSSSISLPHLTSV